MTVAQLKQAPTLEQLARQWEAAKEAERLANEFNEE